MSEPIPESIPTSADPRSHRPIKRARGPGASNPNLKAASAQANEIETLFLDPSREVKIPSTSSDSKKSLPAPPEIVANVQGSSAGAGSGEFHVYKASRRREYERLRVMDEEAKREEEEKEWEEKEKERKMRDEEKTRKNREKRNKKKGKGKKDQKSSNGEDGGKENGKSIPKGLEKKRAGNLGIPSREDRDEDDTAPVGGADFGVAEVVKENGITIHDDD